jgi:hypothetical protein
VQHPQIEDALPATAYDSADAPVGAYLGRAAGDALNMGETQQKYI